MRRHGDRFLRHHRGSRICESLLQKQNRTELRALRALILSFFSTVQLQDSRSNIIIYLLYRDRSQIMMIVSRRSPLPRAIYFPISNMFTGSCHFRLSGCPYLPWPRLLFTIIILYPSSWTLFQQMIVIITLARFVQ